METDREYVVLSLEVNEQWRNDAPQHFFTPPVGATDDFRYGMSLRVARLTPSVARLTPSGREHHLEAAPNGSRSASVASSRSVEAVSSRQRASDSACARPASVA